MHHFYTVGQDGGVLRASLDNILASPADVGVVELIVRRPAQGERELLDEAELSEAVGLVGDNWLERGSRQTEDGSADLARQITVMNARVAEAVALDGGGEGEAGGGGGGAGSGGKARWAEAGDQFFVDFDITEQNLPAGTRLHLGDAVIEVSDSPHNGCAKFANRFGVDAARFVNTPATRHLRLRGMNARVVVGGSVRAGDVVRKAAWPAPVTGR
jgi:hypothetical protein